MQNDLISRRNLIKALNEKINRNTQNSILRVILYDVISIVKEQPTAYSVEKVVAELEENGQKMSEAKAIRPYAKHSPSDHRYYKAISVKKAVDIVRNGGKE